MAPRRRVRVRETAIISMVLLQSVAAFMIPLPPAHILAGRSSGAAIGKQQQHLFGERPPLSAVQPYGSRARESCRVRSTFGLSRHARSSACAEKVGAGMAFGMRASFI
jgi:hypothetical protein